MPNDAMRAIQQYVRDFMQSDLGRRLQQDALERIIVRGLPHLEHWVTSRISDIWGWYQRTF